MIKLLTYYPRVILILNSYGSKVIAQEISQSKFVKVLSLDDSIMLKPHTKENVLNCWHYSRCSERNVKGGFSFFWVFDLFYVEYQ